MCFRLFRFRLLLFRFRLLAHRSYPRLPAETCGLSQKGGAAAARIRSGVGLWLGTQAALFLALRDDQFRPAPGIGSSRRCLGCLQLRSLALGACAVFLNRLGFSRLRSPFVAEGPLRLAVYVLWRGPPWFAGQVVAFAVGSAFDVRLGNATKRRCMLLLERVDAEQGIAYGVVSFL